MKRFTRMLASSGDAMRHADPMREARVRTACAWAGACSRVRLAVPMHSMLAACLWFASALASAMSPPSKDSPWLLSEQEVRNPAFVTQWLTGLGAGADRKEADWFYSLGMKKKQANNWSAAAKAFGESMRRYPGPRTLYEYAHAELKMLGKVRARQGFPRAAVRQDMEHALGFYEASLAANSVTSTLSLEEARRVEAYAACLRHHLQASRPPVACPPATYFSTTAPGP